jgi:hypothetical protein
MLATLLGALATLKQSPATVRGFVFTLKVPLLAERVHKSCSAFGCDFSRSPQAETSKQTGESVAGKAAGRPAAIRIHRR